MMMVYVYLLFSWITYYVFHSLLATDKAKEIAFGLIGNRNTWRVIYSLFSTIGLIFLLFFMATIPEDTLWPQSSIVKLTSLICITYGLIIIKLSFKDQSVWRFLTEEDRYEKDNLRTTGIYAKVRHPLYSGTLLIFTGLFLFIPKISTAIALVITILYLIFGVILEEKKLTSKYGKVYEDYKKQVAAIIPRLL
ncbi:MAG: isoprenylcysteine carboxylmethyltransferase family protein [Cyclobacteriaceae bacterium]